MSLPYFLASAKRGLPMATEVLIALQKWLYTEANQLQSMFGYDMELAKRMSGKAHYINNILALLPDDAASADTLPEGQDAEERLDAKQG